MKKPLADFFKACENEDPETKKKAALPTKLFRHLLLKSKPLEKAIGELCNGALFFALRACEYSFTSDPSPKTPILTLGDFTFLKNGKEISVNRKEADQVIIRFQNQKNGTKGEKQIRFAKDNKSYNACIIWGRIIDRISSYQGADKDTPVSTVKIENKFHQIHYDDINKLLKNCAKEIGLEAKEYLITPHSIRVSFATILFAKGVDIETVKLLGRWKSEAVLRYIRSTVEMITTQPALLREGESLQEHIA